MINLQVRLERTIEQTNEPVVEHLLIVVRLGHVKNLSSLLLALLCQVVHHLVDHLFDLLVH